MFSMMDGAEIGQDRAVASKVTDLIADVADGVVREDPGSRAVAVELLAVVVVIRGTVVVRRGLLLIAAVWVRSRVVADEFGDVPSVARSGWEVAGVDMLGSWVIRAPTPSTSVRERRTVLPVVDGLLCRRVTDLLGVGHESVGLGCDGADRNIRRVRSLLRDCVQPQRGICARVPVPGEELLVRLHAVDDVGSEAGERGYAEGECEVVAHGGGEGLGEALPNDGVVKAGVEGEIVGVNVKESRLVCDPFHVLNVHGERRCARFPTKVVQCVHPRPQILRKVRLLQGVDVVAIRIRNRRKAREVVPDRYANVRRDTGADRGDAFVGIVDGVKRKVVVGVGDERIEGAETGDRVGVVEFGEMSLELFDRSHEDCSWSRVSTRRRLETGRWRDRTGERGSSRKGRGRMEGLWYGSRGIGGESGCSDGGRNVERRGCRRGLEGCRWCMERVGGRVGIRRGCGHGQSRNIRRDRDAHRERGRCDQRRERRREGC